VIGIGPRPDRRVYNRSIPAILRRVSVGKHLKFGDSVYSQRGSDKICPGSISPNAGSVGAVNQKQFALRPATRNRKSLRRSESEWNQSCGTLSVFLWNWLDSRRKQG